jgi:3D-(3,5/4)-trihydroxycyclohexane-1,2-dione acylhydrolase (decyclizing)
VSQGIPSYGNEWRSRDRKTGLLAGAFAPVDFARNGESYGARGFTVRTIEELRNAVGEALRESRSTVIDIKVTPKSMTHGYGAWWRVGTAEVSANRKVVAASRRQKAEVAKAKKL